MLTHMFLRVAYTGSEWVLWLLVILSFVNVAFMVDRALYYSRNAINLDELLPQLKQFLKDGNVRGAYDLVQGSQAIECVVATEGLKSMHKGADACAEAMLSAKAKDKGKVEARLSALATIGSNSPFVGLMGTVLGIIKAARDLSDSSGAGASAVMSGVFEALVATAVGLFVAIPAIVAYNIFQKKVKTTMAQVDAISHMILANLVKAGPGGAAAGQAGQPAQERQPQQQPGRQQAPYPSTVG